jgi:hypothetical protein
LAQAAYNGAIKTPGISTTFSTSETFTQLASPSSLTYQIADFTKALFDRDVTPTVYLDGAMSSPTNINYLFGKITVPSSGAVTASGNYLPVTEKAGFNEYTLSLSGDPQDRTTFDNNAGYRRKQVCLLDGSMTLGGFTNPWFYGFTDTTADLTQALTATSTPVTFTISKGSGLVAGNVGKNIRIDDEIFLITALTTTSTAQDTVSASRGEWGTTLAAHSTDAAVFEMNGSIFSRNAFLVEIQPSGSTNDVWRMWAKVESLEESGAVADLRQNSVSLQLDSSTKAGTAVANSAD